MVFAVITVGGLYLGAAEHWRWYSPREDHRHAAEIPFSAVVALDPAAPAFARSSGMGQTLRACGRSRRGAGSGESLKSLDSLLQGFDQPVSGAIQNFPAQVREHGRQPGMGADGRQSLQPINR